MEKYSAAIAAPLLEKLNGWNYKNDGIEKKFVFENFLRAMGFIVQVGILSEKHGHHPEITNTYNKVSLRLTTHDADGLTEKDFALATAIEKL